MGDRLPEVASRYRLSGTQLAGRLRQDPSMFLDRSLNVGYVEPAAPASASAAAPVASPVAGPAPTTAAEVFALSSRPSATRKLLLDFDGHTTSGTSWNSSFTAGASIVSAPFDTDGNSANWSSAEISAMYAVWQMVSEDFVPFDVDVTTADPGVEALRKSSTSDTAFGVRLVVSPTNWYNVNAGGVAYVGSFNWNSDTPAFCFAGQLNNSAKPIGECASHEGGHTVGLSHDGTATTGYYSGQGSWAPIMGVGYYKSITQWSAGEYSGANNLENDLAVMSGYMPYRADDHGDSAGTTTALTPGVPVYGVIGSRTDVDTFSVSFTSSGSVSVSVDALHAASDLDVSLVVRDGTGTVVSSSDPAGLSVAVSVPVGVGTYTFTVDGVGAGDPLSTGYSDYASLGEYKLSVSATVPVNQPPVAAAAASVASGYAPLPVQFSSAGSVDPDGGTLSYLWEFGNGVTSTNANPSYTYASPGNFTARLTVTDPAGASSSASVPVVVSAVPASASLSLVKVSGVRAGRVTVTVLGANGLPVANASVSGAWGGVLSGTASGRTDANGQVSFTSKTSSKTGTLTFSVRSVSVASPYVWDGVKRSASLVL